MLLPSLVGFGEANLVANMGATASFSMVPCQTSQNVAFVAPALNTANKIAPTKMLNHLCPLRWLGGVVVLEVENLLEKAKMAKVENEPERTQR